MNITQELTFDLPISYKKLKIYPIMLRDYLLFSVYSQCFTLDKNSIPNPDIIRMTELEYIYYATNENPEEQPYLIWFDRLLEMCLRDEDSFENLMGSIKRYKYNDKHNPFFVINDEEYDSEDFINIRNIVCEQNLIELPDESISKEVRDSLEEAKKYKNRNSDPATLEDYIIALSTVTGWEIEYIYSMTARKFLKSIKRLDNYIHYKIYLSATMSGMVEFKDTSFIKHWLNNLEEKDKYKDVTVDLDKIQGKLSLEDAKK